MRVGVVLFDQVELLDFAGPVEALWAARKPVADGRWGPAFEIVLLAERPGSIRTAQGVEVVATTALANCGPLDVVLVPGGWGSRAQMKNAVLLNWLREQSRAVQLTASVCTGALVLAAAGLLDGRKATTHWQSLEVLRRSFPKVNVVSDKQVVRDGPMMTSAGVAAGIDLALRIIEEQLGPAAAGMVARNIEYPLAADETRRVPLP